MAVINTGGNYNSTTGVLIDGIYEFTYNLWANENIYAAAFLVLDNVRVHMSL